MKVKLITMLVVCVLSTSVGSVSHATLLLSGSYGYNVYDQSIRENRVPDPSTLTQDDWALAVGVSFMTPAMSSIYYPDSPVAYPDFPGLVLPLIDGASVRMEFEDLVDFISASGISVKDPNYFRLQGGLFPIDTSIYTTSVPRMNHGCSIYSPTDLLTDFGSFDGSQIVGGYVIDYIEWTIHNPVYLGAGELILNSDWGNYYTYSASFTGVSFEVHGELAGTDSTVPEPTTMMLLGLGLMGVAGVRRKFKK